MIPPRKAFRTFLLLLFLARTGVALPGLALPGVAAAAYGAPQEEDALRMRAREAGIRPGVLPTGPLNAITDVEGVRVGHVTLVRGDSVRTGVTAVLPHGGNLYADKVPAGFSAANAFGKFAGSTQIRELGEIETPIVLTNTLSVAQGMEGVIDWTLRQAGNENVRSVNAVVGETNDGFLNDIRGRHVRSHDVVEAIVRAEAGPVTEGAVGAGTGTVSFGWKGGIGTSSRQLPAALGGWTVGVLVQTNYGGILQIDGVRVGEALGQFYLDRYVDRGDADGSVIVVVATNAPLSDRNLERLAHRALYGVPRSGSPATNGSGDYAVAFSTHEGVRRTPERRTPDADGPGTLLAEWPNDRMSPLFQAAMEASEEAIYNALFMATTTSGHRGTVQALPLQRVLDVMGR